MRNKKSISFLLEQIVAEVDKLSREELIKKIATGKVKTSGSINYIIRKINEDKLELLLNNDHILYIQRGINDEGVPYWSFTKAAILPFAYFGKGPRHVSKNHATRMKQMGTRTNSIFGGGVYYNVKGLTSAIFKQLELNNYPTSIKHYESIQKQLNQLNIFNN